MRSHAPIEDLRLMPCTSDGRKRVPLYSGLFRYFPNALIAVARRSQIGNDQHHPEKEITWDKDKSTDCADALLRHLMDDELDALAWRALEILERRILNGYIPHTFQGEQDYGESLSDW